MNEEVEGRNPILLATMTQKQPSFWVVGVPKDIYDQAELEGRTFKFSEKAVTSSFTLDSIRLLNVQRKYDNKTDKVTSRFDLENLRLVNTKRSVKVLDDRVTSFFNVESVGIVNIQRNPERPPKDSVTSSFLVEKIVLSKVQRQNSLHTSVASTFDVENIQLIKTV